MTTESNQDPQKPTQDQPPPKQYAEQRPGQSGERGTDERASKTPGRVESSEGEQDDGDRMTAGGTTGGSSGGQRPTNPGQSGGSGGSSGTTKPGSGTGQGSGSSSRPNPGSGGSGTGSSGSGNPSGGRSEKQ